MCRLSYVPNRYSLVTHIVIKPPTADVLNPLLLLGRNGENGVEPAGSAVLCYRDGFEYLITALHVAKLSNFNPLLRFRKQWYENTWQILAVNEQYDIAILKSSIELDPKHIPILYGEPEGFVYGQVGYALGFPRLFDATPPNTDHITEANGRPIPLAALVVANFTSDKTATYSASYINDGFSGGAIVFPVGRTKWTVAGIITHFPTVFRPVLRRNQRTNRLKETGEFVQQHTGLVGYTPFGVIENIIAESIR